MTRLLCTGDLHIGAGTDHRVDALADQELVLDQIVELARSRQVDLVLIAGDVFHRPKPSPTELHVFARFTAALAEASIPSVAILGNSGHDQWGVDQPTALELFASPWLRISRAPEVIRAAGDVAVCTLPSVPVSRLVAAQGGGDRGETNMLAADLLLATARGLRSEVPDGWPSVLLGHWSVSGASLPNGLPVADLHEPVLDLNALEDLDFSAVVLGHIHNAGAISDRSVFYVGSPSCLNFGEASVNHGAWIVDLDEPSLSDHMLEFVPLDDRRFVTVDVDLTTSPLLEGLDETDAIAAYVAAEIPLTDAVLRIRYRATEEQHRRVDQAALRRLALDAGVHRLYQIAPDIIRGSCARAEHVDETLAPLQAVDAWAAANDLASDRLAALRDLTAELLIEVAA